MCQTLRAVEKKESFLGSIRETPLKGTLLKGLEFRVQGQGLKFKGFKV